MVVDVVMVGELVYIYDMVGIVVSLGKSWANKQRSGVDVVPKLTSTLKGYEHTGKGRRLQNHPYWCKFHHAQERVC